MTRPRPASRRVRPASTSLDERKIEALTVAMTLAPGVYARNRMFEFFASAGVDRAKSRAATLRGVVKHLGRACALSVESEGIAAAGPCATAFVLRYQIPAMRLTRVVELSSVELATLRVLASRAGATCLPADAADRALVASTLARLLVADGDTLALTRAALLAD